MEVILVSLSHTDPCATIPRGVNLYITLGDSYWENWGKCKCRRHEAAIAKGKKLLTTREPGGVS